MNEKIFDVRWSEIKEKIRQRWSKLGGGDLEALRGNLDELIERIQVGYGCGKARAELEYHDFRISLRPLLQPAIEAPVERNIYRSRR